MLKVCGEIHGCLKKLDFPNKNHVNVRRFNVFQKNKRSPAIDWSVLQVNGNLLPEIKTNSCVSKLYSAEAEKIIKQFRA